MATVYVSPQGAGSMDGSNSANAAPLTSLNSMVAKAGAGGSVLMRADQGAYTAKAINITNGGAEGDPVTIKGVDAAGRDMAIDINGSRARDGTAVTSRGGEVFVLSGSASNLKFINIDFHDVLNAYRVKSAVSNIEIGKSETTNVQRFFENRADENSGAPATISGLNIHDVKVSGYSKNVIRLQYDTHDVTVSNVSGDVAGQTFDDFAMGVHLDGTVHNVVFSKVTMLNNQNFMRDYWNGDGFATEGGTHHITFIDTVAKGSTDGGYDLKSDYTTMVRTLAADNGRNYRIWGNNNTMTDSVGLDPHGRKEGGANSQVWIKGGADITIKNSAFVDSGWDTKVFNFDDPATITLDGVTVQHATNAILKAAMGTLAGLNTSTITTVAATGEWSAGSSAGGGSGGTPPAGGQTINGTSAADTLLGSGAADAISGLDGNDLLNGLGGNDSLKGGSGSDTLLGGNGDDTLDGGDGVDVATFTGSRNDYTFRYSGGKIVVDDVRSSNLDGLDTLSNIEKVQFGQGDNAPSLSIKGTHLAETLYGTSGKDIFFYDTATGLGVGGDTVRNFGAGDRLVTTTALLNTSANGADRFEFRGATGFTDDIGSLKVWSSGGSLRTKLALDRVEDVGGIKYYVYKSSGDTTSGRSLGLTTNSAPSSVAKDNLDDESGARVLSGSDKNDLFFGGDDADLFFFDTADQLVNKDTIRGFEEGDRVVTTTMLLDANDDGKVLANDSDRFSFAALDGTEVGSLKIWTDGGKLVTALMLDHVDASESVTHYVYSAVNDLTPTPDLFV